MGNNSNLIFGGFSRRDFLKASAAASAVPTIGASNVFAAGKDKIKVGMIGCGGRATGAMIDCFEADGAVELVAMHDVFQDRIDSSLRKLTKQKDGSGAKKKKKNQARFSDRVKVTPERMFTGFDGYKKVLAIDEIDLIITATPPHFRPIHLKAIVEAGKHCFMEKPVAVDPVGIRSIIETSKLAKQKGLAIVAGTQRRHQKHYIDMMKRIHDGDIGEVVGGQCYWNMGTLWTKPQTEGMSDMEWQLRNWLYFTWLSGDHIVEQHVHNIDVINWAFGTMPTMVMGMGGREVRKGKIHGNIFDHFAIEFEYPNGARVMSMCRQTKGCANRVAEHIAGTKGFASSDGRSSKITGAKTFDFRDSPNPYVQEHKDLIKSIRDGSPLNEGERVAMSTLCAIAGRMSAYTGRAMKFDWALNASKLDLSPPAYEFGPLEVRPVSVPGKTLPV